MNYGIDATNISRGGGLTHLRELLNAAGPAVGDDKVIVWACEATLANLPDSTWLIKVGHPLLNKSLLHRFVWQKMYFENSLKKLACDVLFVPGANYSGSFKPYVSMSQNMLPFEKSERSRFFPSITYLRYLILNFTQSRSFKKSSGLIFLTNYARDIITAQKSLSDVPYATIPHGISKDFSQQHSSDNESPSFNWLYVSIINYYKHQENLAIAACDLAAEGYDISVELVGPDYPAALLSLTEVLDDIDPDRKVVKYIGAVKYNELPQMYGCSDGFIFPSSCENLPNILLEAMASKLAIASSDRGPMPEVLRDAGVYFDPEDVNTIKAAMKKIMDNPDMSESMANKAFLLSKEYTWARCANETFGFLKLIFNNSRINL